MGNCMSTCGGGRKKTPMFTIVTGDDAISLATTSLDGSTNDGEAAAGQSRTDSAATLNRDSPRTKNTSAVSHNGGADLGNDVSAANIGRSDSNNTIGSFGSGGISSGTGGKSSHNTNSRPVVSSGDTRVMTAEQDHHLLTSQPRIVISQSTGDLRTLNRPCGLPRSITMHDLNKPLPEYPNNDPVAAYIERNHLLVQNARQKWNPQIKNLTENQTQCSIMEVDERKTNAGLANPDESDTKTFRPEPLLHNVPLADDGGSDASITGESSEARSTGIRSPSKAYVDTIRAMSHQDAHQDEERMAPCSLPRSPAGSLDHFRPQSPTSPTISTGAASTAGSSRRQHRMSPFESASAPQSAESMGRRDVGYAAGPSEPDSLRRHPPPSLHQGRGRAKIHTQPHRLSVVPESRVSRLNLHNLALQAAADGKNKSDVLWMKAIHEVNKRYDEAELAIRDKVREFVGDENEVAAITENILDMSEEFVDACLDDDGFHLIYKKIKESRRSSRLLRNGNLAALLEDDIKNQTEATKQRKALALMEKWAAEEKAEEKGKAKQESTVDEYDFA